MKRVIYTLLFALLTMGVCDRGMTETWTKPTIWTSGSNDGQLAVTCTTTWQEGVNPFLTPRVIVASNDMPDGTVLASWGYGEFGLINGISYGCQSSGIHNSDYPHVDDYSYNLQIRLKPPTTKQPRGVELIIYGEYTTENIPCPSSAIRCWGVGSHQENMLNNLTGASPSYNPTPPFIEYPVPTAPYYSHEGKDFNFILAPMLVLSEPPTADYVFASASGNVRFRAELVKSGSFLTSDSGSTLEFNTEFLFSLSTEGHGAGLIRLSPTNITFIVSNCQLKTKDYIISMSNWGTRPTSTLPASGSETPINIALKCDDEVPHVRFRFEDTGASPLANHNISLYSAEGGEKVDGLEIEMLYNGAHVDIDNTTLVDTGEHGTAGAVGADSTAKFTARYVQRSEITKNGNAYVGPVTGKVNMRVTYD